jgi:hypothetical protein
MIVRTMILLGWAMATAASDAKPAFSDRDLVQIRSDTVRCEANAGKSDAVSDQITLGMERIYGRLQSRNLRIGAANHADVIRWFSCMTRYTLDGGDEELGYAAGLCDSFVDSDQFRKELKLLSSNHAEIGKFRKYLIDYASNTNVDCR